MGDIIRRLPTQLYESVYFLSNTRLVMASSVWLVVSRYRQITSNCDNSSERFDSGSGHNGPRISPWYPILSPLSLPELLTQPHTTSMTSRCESSLITKGRRCLELRGIFTIYRNILYSQLILSTATKTDHRG